MGRADLIGNGKKLRSRPAGSRPRYGFESGGGDGRPSDAREGQRAFAFHLQTARPVMGLSRNVPATMPAARGRAVSANRASAPRRNARLDHEGSTWKKPLPLTRKSAAKQLLETVHETFRFYELMATVPQFAGIACHAPGRPAGFARQIVHVSVRLDAGAPS